MKVAVVIVLALLAVPASTSEAAVKRTVRANLDGDGRREAVQLITTTRPNPFGGTVPLHVAYVRVVDRRAGRLVKRRLSPWRLERARFRVRDLNRDGRPEVWFVGFAGNGFFSFAYTPGPALAAAFSGAGTTTAREWAGAALGLVRNSGTVTRPIPDGKSC